MKIVSYVTPAHKCTFKMNITEAVVRCSVKTMFNNLKSQVCNFIKKETPIQMFPCEFCEISKNKFFYRRPLVTASDITTIVSTSWINLGHVELNDVMSHLTLDIFRTFEDILICVVVGTKLVVGYLAELFSD